MKIGRAWANLLAAATSDELPCRVASACFFFTSSSALRLAASSARAFSASSVFFTSSGGVGDFGLGWLGWCALGGDGVMEFGWRINLENMPPRAVRFHFRQPPISRLRMSTRNRYDNILGHRMVMAVSVQTRLHVGAQAHVQPNYNHTCNPLTPDLSQVLY